MKQRSVKSALVNSLLDYPTKRLTINLAPAELPKEGTHYDLGIALSILVASGQLPQDSTKSSLFAGELSLDGLLRPIRAVITVAEIARNAGLSKVYVPLENICTSKARAKHRSYWRVITQKSFFSTSVV